MEKTTGVVHFGLAPRESKNKDGECGKFVFLCRFLKKNMEQEGYNKRIYSRNAIEFVTVANGYCHFIEQVNTYLPGKALTTARKILPLLYLKASMLPDVEKILDEATEKFVTELDYNLLLQKWMQKLGENDSYREVFDPGKESTDEILEASISENLLDIYQDIKDFVSLYSLGNEEVMNDALSECLFQFKEYWGQKLVNVLRAIHRLLVSDADLDETRNSSIKHSIQKESDWVDGFFNQFRDDNNKI
jgi:hypothetical protein